MEPRARAPLNHAVQSSQSQVVPSTSSQTPTGPNTEPMVVDGSADCRGDVDSYYDEEDYELSEGESVSHVSEYSECLDEDEEQEQMEDDEVDENLQSQMECQEQLEQPKAAIQAPIQSADRTSSIGQQCIATVQQIRQQLQQ